LRILVLCASFWPALGGMERITEELLLALQERHHQVAVFCNSAPGQPERATYRGISVFRADLENILAWQDLEVFTLLKKKVQDLLSEFQPDCLHISGSHFGLLFLLQFVRHRLPTLATLHGPMVGRDGLLPPSSRMSLARAHRIVCCSQWTLVHAREQLPELTDRLSLVVNALRFPGKRPSWKHPSTPRLLFAGRLAKEKGLDVALAALSLLPEDFHLSLAGEGPAQAAALQQLEQQGLSHRVHFLGRLSPPALLEEMGQSLALIVPSHVEGFGLVALEASWVGCPVVASEVGGLPEVVLDQQTGLLVTPKDPAALAQAALQLWQRPEWTRQLSSQARQRVDQTFCWETFVEQYLQIYQQVLAHP